VVAAWPAASLVGSYELLLWLIRTSAAGSMARDDVSGHVGEPADHLATDLRLLRVPEPTLDEGSSGAMASLTVDHASGPAEPEADHAYRYMDRPTTDRSAAKGSCPVRQDEEEVNLAAMATYRASLEYGRPLSQRKLAAMYGRTSRRWARNRIAEARQVPIPATAKP
jgi:hypothetical protein